MTKEKPTLEDWKNKHPDYKTTIDGKKYCLQLIKGKGTCLVPIQE